LEAREPHPKRHRSAFFGLKTVFLGRALYEWSGNAGTGFVSEETKGKLRLRRYVKSLQSLEIKSGAGKRGKDVGVRRREEKTANRAGVGWLGKHARISKPKGYPASRLPSKGAPGRVKYG